MTIAGRDVLVSTMFTIVEQIEQLYNVKPDEPALWITEVIGGPSDIDGTFQFSCSRDEATQNHALMVERMTVSGCTAVD